MGVPRQNNTERSPAQQINTTAITPTPFHYRFIEQTLREARGSSTDMVTDEELVPAPVSTGKMTRSTSNLARSASRPVTPSKSLGQTTTTVPQKKVAQHVLGTKMPVVVLPPSHMPKAPAVRVPLAEECPPQGEGLITPEAGEVPQVLSPEAPKAPEGFRDNSGSTNHTLVTAGLGALARTETSVPINVNDDIISVSDVDDDQITPTDPRKDRGSMAYEKYHHVSTRGHEVTVYTMVAIYPLEHSTEAEMIAVPNRKREDPLYSSAYYCDGVKRRTGMVFPIDASDISAVMVIYEGLEEFNKLRGLALQKLVLQSHMVRITGRFEYGSGEMQFGRVNYQQAPFSPSTGRVEKMQISHLVLRMTRPEDSVQCCLNMSLLSFNDLTMHVISTVVSTVPTGADLLRHPQITRVVRLVVPALQDYLDWHAQCVQWANVEPNNAVSSRATSSSSSPPLLPVPDRAAKKPEKPEAIRRPDSANHSQGAGLPPVVERTTMSAEIHANPNPPPDYQATPASPDHEPCADGPPVTVAYRRDPRVGSPRGVYSPMGTPTL